jgi:hypothetical protein
MRLAIAAQTGETINFDPDAVRDHVAARTR